MALSHKWALITGASSGIGKALAYVHAKRGGNLIIVARREKQLLALKDELEQTYSVEVEVIAKDLTQPNTAQQLYNEVKTRGLSVEYLINNAGFGGLGKFHERPWELDKAMIQLNILALTELSRLFLPDFVARNSGRILNVSSTASLVPGPLQAVYYAGKAYVTSFSYALAEELRTSSVTVTALLPGATESEFAGVSGMDKTLLFQKPYRASSVAHAGYKAMEAGKLSVVAGISFGQRLMLLAIPLLPKKLILQQISQMQQPRS
ncbi:SDR family oxidoreductase [Candidatus Haliotispira prima]|uniref:SDR family oxidoreductase n=1 Tax=Candidatus Haliotispira prima TaxID=3034016 RepID=A0ABY8MG59_9SPIO|nr:SDR family oxidoreductase [Candidatus Haliotispira prima]